MCSYVCVFTSSVFLLACLTFPAPFDPQDTDMLLRDVLSPFKDFDDVLEKVPLALRFVCSLLDRFLEKFEEKRVVFD